MDVTIEKYLEMREAIFAHLDDIVKDIAGPAWEDQAKVGKMLLQDFVALKSDGPCPTCKYDPEVVHQYYQEKLNEQAKS